MKQKLKPVAEQSIVITGASSGIGLATALAASALGARLTLVARSEMALTAIADEIRAAGGQAAYEIADVADRAAMQRAAERALDRYGGIDTWINNAGVAIYGRLEAVSDEDNRRLFETNFWGVVYGSLVAMPYLRQRGGALINIGSEVSDAVVPLQGMYATSKHAVKGFTDALRVEVQVLDKAPVSITLIQPTAVNTPYPEHARNYMGREPKLPSPQIDPTQVAQAILEAACEGGRDVKVGAMSKLNSALSNLMPSLGDRMAALQADRQQEDRAPEHPEGTLFQPGESGRVHGHPPTKH
jgi:short-subunit dehydrogenase